MTTTLLVIVAVLGAGAVATLIGTLLINRAHRPRGRFIEVGGFRQHVVELNAAASTGAAMPVVLLHGAGANLEDMHLALGERLAARRRVILVDRPGQGFSARKAGEGCSPRYQAAVLREVLRRIGIERAILVGHSWGGTLALAFALDFPECAAGLVLAAPPTHPGFYNMSKLNALLATPLGWLFAYTLALPFG
jgi:pimeloyl-ACP methyl ester carboxylesterase